MKHLLAVLFIFSLAVTVRADVVMEFIDYPSDQNGHSISGTVTLAGAGICDPCSPSDFVGFNLNVTGPLGFATSGTSTNILISPIGTSGITADGTKLVWAESPEEAIIQFSGSGGFLLYQSRPHSGGAGPLLPIYRAVGGGNLVWNSVLPVDISRTIAAVPEPSAFLYFLLLGTSIGCWKNRHQVLSLVKTKRQ
ncbi:MAG: hypothetical protein KDA92_19225 [Planctomycetales bacterium]|nr:hypothetical protein [Planctomycetales bacterium]